MSLGQLVAVGAQDHGQVREGGHVVAEGLVDEDLARGVGQVVVAADDVGDAHVGVVADHGEVVGGRAVGAHDDHVVHDVGGEGHVAVDGVVELDGAVLERHLQAPHVRLAGLDAAGGLGRVAQLGGSSVLVISTCGVEVFLIIIQCVATCISRQGRQPLFQLG